LNKIMEFTKKESGIFYLIEGSDCYTLITQEKYCEQVLKVNSSKIIQKASNLVLVNYISPKDIEFIPGVISYITSRFTENGINIVEMFSCWTDTLFVINAKDLTKVISFLNIQ
jgi:aspartokinase